MRCAVIVVSSALTLVGVVFPSAAIAQERAGFWFGLGGGYGSANITCDDCEDGREGGGVAYLKGGWTLNERVLVGGEFNLWSKDLRIEEDVEGTVNLYNVSGTVTFYPTPSSGFFVKGGAGASFVDAEVRLFRTRVTVDLGSGFGLLAGVGYDIPVGRRVSVTPAVNFWYGQLGDLKVGRETLFGDWKQNVVDFTIGITFP